MNITKRAQYFMFFINFKQKIIKKIRPKKKDFK